MFFKTFGRLALIDCAWFMQYDEDASACLQSAHVRQVENKEAQDKLLIFCGRITIIIKCCEIQ